MALASAFYEINLIRSGHIWCWNIPDWNDWRCTQALDFEEVSEKRVMATQLGGSD